MREFLLYSNGASDGNGNGNGMEWKLTNENGATKLESVHCVRVRTKECVQQTSKAATCDMIELN